MSHKQKTLTFHAILFVSYGSSTKWFVKESPHNWLVYISSPQKNKN